MLAIDPGIELQISSRAETFGLSVDAYLARLIELESQTISPNLLLASGLPAGDAAEAQSVDREERFRREQAWVAANRAAYAGKWIALDGDCLIASGDEAKEVFATLRRLGQRASVRQVEDRDIEYGGW